MSTIKLLGSVFSVTGRGVVRGGRAVFCGAALYTVTLCLSGCEYEWREDRGDAAPYQVSKSEEAAEQEAPLKQVRVEPVQTEFKPVIAPGRDISGQAELPPKARKINLSELGESGALMVSANAPTGDLGLSFDEREDTLSKSEGVNPYRITFEFKDTKTIKAIRVLSTYSDYSWAFAAEGSERLLVDTVIDGAWSTMTWPEGLKVKRFYVEVLRKQRDNYVHVNEVEVYE
jgi:hypothetical protein